MIWSISRTSSEERKDASLDNYNFDESNIELFINTNATSCMNMLVKVDETNPWQTFWCD